MANNITFVKYNSYKLHSMFIIDIDEDTFLEHLWGTSESIKSEDIKIEDLSKEKVRVCYLDPGGMYIRAIPHVNFIIDGFEFNIQYSKVGLVLHYVRRARERMPGVRRIYNWLNNVILSESLWEKLKDKLEEIESSSETLHAELNQCEVIEDLNKHPNIKIAVPQENN